jgi:hypothetical protein
MFDTLSLFKKNVCQISIFLLVLVCCYDVCLEIRVILGSSPATLESEARVVDLRAYLSKLGVTDVAHLANVQHEDLNAIIGFLKPFEEIRLKQALDGLKNMHISEPGHASTAGMRICLI